MSGLCLVHFLFIPFLGIFFQNVDCSQDSSWMHRNDLRLENESHIKLKNQVPSNCSTIETLDCLRSEIFKMAARLESKTPLQITPGLSLIWDQPASQKLSSPEIVNFETLLKAINAFLSSFALKVQLVDESTMMKGARSLREMFQSNDDGRKRKDNNGMLGLAMAMKASMMSMALAAVAAMSGKALLMSMMALAFAALSAAKGSGSKTTTYEIKHEPAHHHGHYKRSITEEDYYNTRAFKNYSAL